MKKYKVIWFDSLLMRIVEDEFDTKEQAEAVRKYRDWTRKWWQTTPKVEEIENGEN